MGPTLAFIGLLALVFACLIFFKTMWDNRKARKELINELEGFVAEIDSKLSRLEQQEQLGERYQRIRDRLERLSKKHK